MGIEEIRVIRSQRSILLGVVVTKWINYPSFLHIARITNKFSGSIGGISLIEISEADDRDSKGYAVQVYRTYVAMGSLTRI